MALQQLAPLLDVTSPHHPFAKSRLNLGCGRKYDENAVNLDIPTSDVRADIWHDLNLRPWPFNDNTFEEVIADDVIEHLRDVIPTMEEIHRICQPGAVVRIALPHFSCANAYADPTHLHYFSYFSFDYVTGERAFYTTQRFRIRQRSIVFHPTVLNKIVWRLANRRPDEYERRWAWMFPAWFLSFELEVLK